MKKTNFQGFSFEDQIILNRQQLKNIVGGSFSEGGDEGEGGCCAHAFDPEMDGEHWCCGLSKSAAIAKADAMAITYDQANWCCASCTQYTDQEC